MGYYNFPHTRNYDTDLGYLIKQYLKLSDEVELLLSSQTITYADPLQWNITTQYKVNTIVINGYNAYLSKQPVPKGILITNTDYWLTVGDFIKEFEDLRNNIADANNGVSPTLLVDRKKDDLLWWNDSLYQCLTDIAAGTALIVNTNIKQITIEDYVVSKQTQMKAYVDNANTQMKTYVDNANTSLTNLINDEKTARVTGDENTLASAKAYTDARVTSNNLAIIGDSWSVGYTEDTGPGYVDIIESKHLFDNVYKSVHGGVGYYTTVDGINYGTLADDLISAHPNDVGTILVQGSVNDINASYDLVLSSCRTVLTKLKNAYPHAKIYVVGSGTLDYNNDQYRISLIPYVVAQELGILQLRTPHALIWTRIDYYTSDKYHLNHTGCIAYAQWIIDEMFGQEPTPFDDWKHIDSLITLAPDISISTIYTSIQHKGRYAIVYIPDISCTGVGGQSLMMKIPTTLMPHRSSTFNQDYILNNSGVAYDKVDTTTFTKTTILMKSDGTINRPFSLPSGVFGTIGYTIDLTSNVIVDCIAFNF